MTNKKIIQKETSVLKMKLNEVFVAKSVKNRAYIEQFTHTSVNFTQKHLGTICGFFVIRNESKYNAHIVNVLTSEIKKEFFSVSRRSISEAFESALYKCNKVLTKLAEEGNTEWLGSIDGAVCAFDTSTIYFSVTGEASVYLIRDRNIINISEGLASQEAHEFPMKTFVDTSQGPLYEFDRVIVTSKELLHLISPAELKNNSIRFSDEEFNQLISTILKNESNLAATTIINVSKKTIKEPIINSETKLSNEEELNQQINAFGADTFIQKEKKSPEIDTNNKEEIEKKPKENYTDKRTGHIYVKANKSSSEERTQFSVILNKAKDVTSDLSYEIKTQSSKISYKLAKSSKKTFEELKLFMKSERVKQVIPNTKKFLKEKSKQVSGITTKIKNQKKTLENKNKSQNEKKKKEKKDTEATPNPKIDTIINTENVSVKNSKNEEKTSKKKEIGKKIISQTKKIKDKSKVLVNKFKEKNDNKESKEDKTQNLKLLKNFFVTKRNKMIFVVSFVCFLILVPVVLDKIYNKKQIVLVKEDEIDVSDEKSSPNKDEKKSKNSQQTKEDKNTKEIGTKITDVSNTKLITPLTNGTVLITTTNSFIKIDKNNKKSTKAIPKEYGNLVLATYMSDLSYVFFITDKNTMYSYSPKVDKFEKQKIKQTLNYKNIKALNSYLTYIYTLEGDKIKRFARIEGGFDKPVIWYKGTSFTKTTSCSIDGDIYVANNKKLSIFSQKNITNKHIDNNTKVDIVYTDENSNLFWVLDKANKNLKAYDKKTLSLVNTIDNDILNKTTNIAVKKNTVIISTNTSIYKILTK